MNALPCPSDVGQRVLDEQADAELLQEARAEALNEMASLTFWLRKWHVEDDSADAMQVCYDLGLLLLERDLPYGTSERADALRDTYECLRTRLRDCFDRWATAGKPSHLDCYQEAERLAREADRADDMEGEA